MNGLYQEYEKSLTASGLVDGVDDLMALDPRPFRYSEGDLVCQHGDEAECLWVIVSGSVAVRESGRTLFIRGPNEVVGEQNLLGNGCRRWYDQIVNETQAELLEIRKGDIERHPDAKTIWRNVAKIISLKLKDASIKTSSITRQLEDDTRILRAYTNQYALSRRLQSGGGRLTSYHVDRAIVWFSDVVDFSRHILNLPPARTADIVQRFFNAQSGPIEQHGGHIDKFIGDGLMAFWVLTGDEDAGAKCHAALAAAEESLRLVSEICVGKHPLHVRIGLHIGLVLSGDFGSSVRHQFTLIGPEVNKAARLEQIHEEDIVEGRPGLGPIRLSVEFQHELSEDYRKKYSNHYKVQAKNIGIVELYS